MKLKRNEGNIEWKMESDRKCAVRMEEWSWKKKKKKTSERRRGRGRGGNGETIREDEDEDEAQNYAWAIESCQWKYG